VIRVYVAAPKGEVLRARQVAALVNEVYGAATCSTWHASYQDGTPDPTDRELAHRILDENLRDLAVADVVLALPRFGTGVETYVEIGRALAAGIFVVMSAEHGGLPLSRVDDGAKVYATDAAALVGIAEIARGSAH